jgi:hypothetical protein
MDTKEKKLRQGASANLSRQKPHTDVVKTKTSAASSDEEKLAAGISTIRLQHKRISGAQRKNFIRERRWRGPGRLKLLQEKLLHLK